MSATETQHDSSHAELADMLAASATDFCARALPRSRLRGLRGASPAFDRALWRQMAELGWTDVLRPATDGGCGLVAATALCRQLGAVAAPEPLLETAIAAVSLLQALAAGADLHDALARGERVVVVALGTPGEDVFGAVQAAVHDDTHVLTGSLACVPLGADADDWLVPATLEREPAWFHVSAGDSGLRCDPLLLADGSRDARVTFSRCAARRLGSGALAAQALERARHQVEVASSAYLLGLADSLFALTVEYVGTRRQFGQAIGSFQVIQHRLVDLYLQLRLTEAVVNEAASELDAGTGDAALAASRARYRACGAVLLLAREAVQLHGAMGYTDECDVGLLLNRALVVCARYGSGREHVARIVAQQSLTRAPADAGSASRYAPDYTPPDGDWNALSDLDFRTLVRDWHVHHYPAALRNPRARLRWQDCRDWYATLHARGWAAPAWPRVHGGMGLSPDKLLIFFEERERLGVARTPDQGIIMVGPVLMQYGSAEQQAYYLPRALSGEHIWCQGYSEPNAGSDLASLSTRAIQDGEYFVITGQKIWTTLAQDATHMFCLVRTDPAAKPQAGISFVLIDLDVPGITIRPIRNIAGDEEFCEVFLDEVRVPTSNLVGRLNDGWTIAKALLGFERIFIGSPKSCQYALNRLGELARARGLMHDAVFLDQYTRYALDTADLETLYKEFAQIVRRGAPLGADVSLLKIFASETFSRMSEFIVECAGSAGARVGDIDFDGEAEVDVLSPYYNARPTPIYGGSNEIQRNILAKQVLKLPSR